MTKLGHSSRWRQRSRQSHLRKNWGKAEHYKSMEREKTESKHRTVLLNETIEGLNLTEKSILVDGTFGGGGHSFEICKRYKGIKIIALDQDESALEKSRSKFEAEDCKIDFINENFRNID